MKSWKPLALGGLLLGVATATVVPFASRSARSVRALGELPRSASTLFDRRQSAALFVGVRQFTSESVAEVPFAVDDAIDLAYVFALERRVALVPPRRVVLLLSGRAPVKGETRARLRALRDAGAEVRFRAEASDVRAALREQTALAGRDGLLVVSIATHGFLREGSGYILGASSVFRDPSTMLPTSEVFETIASSAAQRSLVFVDACRERMAGGTRSVLGNTTSAAPLVGRLSRTRGQVVFYAAAAGQWAYDDPAAHNGVFTKAVIGGMNCGAAKVRGVVTAETLASYVERSVHTWIRDNRDPNVGSATQVSMDGEARNMPLARCWGDAPGSGPARVTASETTVGAFSDKNQPLWQRDAGGVVTHAEAVDLDADGSREVVFTTPQSVAALDADGKELWSVHEAMTPTTFVTGDLFRQHTNEVVALWNDEHSSASRLAVYSPDGKLLGAFDSKRRLDRVTIGCPTKRHAPKIVATSGNLLLVFDPKKLAAGKLLWSGRISPRSGKIDSIQIVDCNGDGKRDIAITTNSGAKVFIDFSGHVIRADSRARFERVAPKRGR
ncbi:MAG: hypothetical protein QOC81_2937 [Thermoanaerobaculia bacterium]|nr:hypothetical protein [Thermoanaerobaculia bacterium]